MTFEYATWTCETCDETPRKELPEFSMGTTSSREFAEQHANNSGHKVVKTVWTPIKEAS